MSHPARIEAEPWADFRRAYCADSAISEASIPSSASDAARARLYALASGGQPAPPAVDAAAFGVAALDLGDALFWSQGDAAVSALFWSAGVAVDALAALGHHAAEEPAALAPLICGAHRTVAQSRAWVALRRGTLALTHRRCADSERHLLRGLRVLQEGGQHPDKLGQRSIAALLMNNLSEWSLHCDEDRATALELRGAAVDLARSLGATETLGVASAGMAFLYAEGPRAGSLPVEPAAAAVSGAEHMERRWRNTQRDPAGAQAGMVAKAWALLAWYRAQVDGAQGYEEVWRWVERALALASTTDAVYAEVSTAALCARALVEVGDWGRAKEVYGHFAAALALLWKRYEQSMEQRGMYRTTASWIEEALMFCARSQDAALAFDLLERSKDLALLERLSGAAPTDDTGHAAALIPPEPVRLSELIAALGPGETAIHLEELLEPPSILALVVSQHGAKLHCWPAPRGKGESTTGARGPQLREDPSLAYASLLEPLEEQLQAWSTRDIWLSPRGYMHEVPWAWLGSDGEPEAMSRYSFTLTPSFSAGLRARSSALDSRHAARLFVDASRFDVAKELVRLESLGLEGEAELNFDGLQRRGNPVWLVLGHGTYDTDSPLRSHLQLTPLGGHHGKVTLGEMAGWRISPAVVVLESCSTASARPEPGDQIDSFNRALLAAGAKVVLAPTKAVDTASAHALTEAFLGALLRGDSAAHALQHAQQAAAATAHDSTARAFQLVGDGSAKLAPWPVLAPGR